jgi:methylenetetrahydrofolate dehydrogenase (NADP+) / methenyltetrahydrofolate cyclohydrolase
MEAETKLEVNRLLAAHGRAPGLAVILVGDDAASSLYVKRKAQACKRVGIHSNEHRLPARASEAELLHLIERLNEADDVDGILVQLPLPQHMDKDRILRAVRPAKDVDAFHPENVGQALLGRESMAPCTAHGILLLLDHAGTKLVGSEVVIINHSDLIGKPLAALLINRRATVTVCHADTRDVAAHARRADVVVTGTGGKRPLVASDIKSGAIVIDVSIVRDADGRVRGDVADDVWEKARFVTPVPGGVGPMTIAVLLQNTLRSYRASQAAPSRSSHAAVGT